ncbi:MAG: hypothetical protein COW24_04385 [Candidatus Kerfeldbacteria bacterium CG15_BIG_FIL_POST_REV_8_21_14_020_45_12]|uniref:Uncharacterized protein n=1 Tax=Candidatus Kerfeldbacteria bacterium CG15_BIG_FIL_POST_REV_8_21_14_020_45_12 TaxID=2014247 RepID=A0A2M7H2Z9_9BACT|nr:MAG: hypothetical protein COW24_04385 [Candidatus Kerfeldbacteria bacterium CG15_BIG_FIL_POST_REV_8_21_14_020_45_12]PJA93387.1 MAG: hypothetical protein CO132_03460 [Candidatus Kerfeldbacteria bacterium CG_4_9_14_3_um_filter_45_8]
MKNDPTVLELLRRDEEVAWQRVQVADNLKKSSRLADYCKAVAAISLIKAKSVEFTEDGRIVIVHADEPDSTLSSADLPPRPRV